MSRSVPKPAKGCALEAPVDSGRRVDAEDLIDAGDDGGAAEGRRYLRQRGARDGPAMERARDGGRAAACRASEVAGVPAAPRQFSLQSSRIQMHRHRTNIGTASGYALMLQRRYPSPRAWAG